MLVAGAILLYVSRRSYITVCYSQELYYCMLVAGAILLYVSRRSYITVC